MTLEIYDSLKKLRAIKIRLYKIIFYVHQCSIFNVLLSVPEKVMDLNAFLNHAN